MKISIILYKIESEKYYYKFKNKILFYDIIYYIYMKIKYKNDSKHIAEIR